MTYAKGELIVASDFNTFRTTLLNIYDVGNGNAGYGQVDAGGQTAIPSVAIGELIKSTEWTLFRNAAQTCSDHQGSVTNFPPASEHAVGEIVEAHEFASGNSFDYDDGLAVITGNRLNIDPSSVTTFSNALNSTRNVVWSVQLQHRFTVTFATVDQARYFFNSGGQIRFRGSRSGGASSGQNMSWSGLLDNMGTFVMDYSFTFQQGGGPGWTGTSIGYYDLTTVFQQIAIGFPQGGGYGYYGGYGGYGSENNVTIEARTVDGPGGANGDNGRQLEFRILYTDGHTSIWFDQVDGTITSDIDYRKATSPLVIASPVFATSVGLSAGS